MFLRGSLLSESLSTRPRLVTPAVFLAHLMYTPPSLQKELAQEAQMRGRLRANRKNLFSITDNQDRNDSRTGLSMRS